MSDQRKTEEALLTEMAQMRQRIAELEKMEERHREVEEKYKSLYENAPLPYQLLDENGRFLDVNPAWLKMLGYKKEEVIGEWFGDFLHRDWQPVFKKNFLEFKKCGTAQDVQFKIRCGNGRYLHISFEGVAETTPDGQFKQTYCVFQDITKQKESILALKESELKLRLLADYTYDWEYWIDSEGNYIYISPSCERITGYKPEAFRADPNLLFKITHPDYRGKIQQHYHDENNKNSPIFATIFPIINKNGDEIWIEHNCSPVFDKDGVFIGRRGNNRDITDRKRVEEKLRLSERHLSLVFNNTSDLQILWAAEPDSTFRALAVNKPYIEALAMLMGKEFSEENFIGKTMKEMFLIVGFGQEVLYSILLNNCQKAVTTGEPVKYVESADLPTGPYHSEITLTPLFDEGDRIQYVLHNLHVITELKQAADNLQKLNAELDERVRDRTADLNQMVQLMAGREVRMAELKKVIKKLRVQLESAGFEPVANDPLISK